ncbi:TonB-dependent receptor [Ideonella sp. 4Y11]|uniref:TonB-dependent receptor n=1 Tax=Ideonella aquatica TaxID=2824119 RepID=A0A940YIK0_9BURK|nr:TonB-dependent receptor [Ideonella aquatica]MBQ0960129.1 TonB-dependent receptor [Ideonella aquatica]
MQTLRLNALAGTAIAVCAGLTHAEDAPQTVEVSGRHYDNAVGSSEAASQGVIRAELLKSRPALRPGEVLEFVPGVIVTQHSGDGKANQYFLRGFNLDHGTDFATTVAGLPVNMPTHGHGQGYSDLNFLIPELVDRITYRKGPTFATHGDFASAGAADIAYRTRLDAPFVQLTLGENGYRRAVGGGSTELAPDTALLGVVEWMGNDGPWTVPENLQRRNGVLTLSQGSRTRGWSASAMAYDARWTSTDQVPQRLIDAGTYLGQPFGRFDSLDASDGGSTSRASLSGEWHRADDAGEARVSAYAMRYRLKLFSNFTYALERPATGDQFSQQDARSVYGLQAAQAWQISDALRTELGAQLRHDRIRVGLFDTQARRILATTREDEVVQTQAALYAQAAWQATPWLKAIAGLRADSARFQVDSLKGDAIAAANTGRANDRQLSPKLSLVLGPWAKTEFFINAGRGLHSNDARGTTAHRDPKTGEAVDPVPGLVPQRGWELGLRTEAVPGLQSSLALWQLRSASELVYVGDAGATEASGASTRRGIEFNNRWTPSRHWLIDADLAWTHARFDNGERIPNAVDHVASVAATMKDYGPWSASLQWRYLGSGALIEDNSQRTRPSSTLNLRASRDLRDWLGRPATLTLDVFNLTNRQVDDIQYWYESQLSGEAAPVDDRIVHPAEPRSLRLTLAMRF